MKNCLALVFSIAISFLSFGQRELDFKAYQEKYSDEQMVVLSTTEVVEIDILNGELDIVKHTEEEILYLTDKASRYNKESIGFGFFSDIENIEAKAFMRNEKGKHKTYKVKTFRVKDEWTPGIFHDDSKSINFYYGGLKEGSQTSLKFDRVIKQPRFSDAMYFNSPVPVEKQSFKVICHPDVDLTWKEFNMEGVKVNFTETEQGGKKVYEWISENLEDIKFDEGAPSYSSYAAHMVVYVQSYKNGGEVVGLQRNTGDLFSWYDELITQHLEESGDISDALIEVVDSIATPEMSELEKIQNIFYWTQDNIKYVAFEAGMEGFIPRSANLICERKYGDCKDMAAIINAMAKQAGVKTNFVWIGSRSIPYKYSELPTPMVDNHMIASYIDDSGKVYFLDATGKEEDFGTPTAFIQGKEALIKTGDGEHIVKQVPIIPAQDNLYSEVISLKMDDDKLVGNGVATIKGYYKGLYAYKTEGLDDDEMLKFQDSYFTKGNNKCDIDVTDESDLDEKGMPLKVTYDLEIQDYVISVDDELIVNLNLEKFYSTSRLKSDREAPKEFRFLSAQQFEIEFEIPEGYEVTVTPSNRSFDENGMKADFNYNVTESKIIYTVDISVGKLVLKPEDFDSWNALIKELKAAYREAVVMKKIN